MFGSSGEHLEGVLQTGETADVLRRAGPLTGDTARLPVLRRQRPRRLQRDPVLPAVAEVVLVEQPLARLGEHLVEAHVALRDALLAFLDVVVEQEVLAGEVAIVGTHHEVVQVEIVQPMAIWMISCSRLSVMSLANRSRRQIGGRAPSRSTRTT